MYKSEHVKQLNVTVSFSINPYEAPNSRSNLIPPPNTPDAIETSTETSFLATQDAPNATFFLRS